VNTFVKSQFFRKLMLSYMLILMVPILILCGLMFQQLQLKTVREAEQEMDNKARLAAITIDNKFAEMNAMGDRLAVSNWVKRVQSTSDIIGKEFDVIRKRELSEEMSVYNSTIRVTQDIALMLPNKQQIINAVSWWEEDRYLFSIGIRDVMRQKIILDELSSPTFIKLMRIEGNDNFFLIRSLSMTDSPSAKLLFYINGEQFSKFISDNQGQFLLKISLMKGEELIFTMRTANQKAKGQIVKVESSMFPWQYELEVLPPTKWDMKNLLLTVIALFISLLPGTFAAYMLAKASYLPIKRLLIKTGMKTEVDGRAFQVIERSFERLNEENQELKHLSQQYYEGGRNSLLINLLKGYFNSYTIDKDIVRFGVNIHEGMTFQAYILQYVHAAEESEDGLKTMIIMKDHLKVLPVNFGYELIEIGSGRIVALVYTSNESQSELSSIDERLRTSVKKSEHVKLISGTREQGLIGISKSYQNAKEMLVSPVVQTASLNVSEKRYYYPIDWEIQLINYLKIGNYKLVAPIMEELKKVNLERNLPTVAAEKVTSLIFETFIRIMEETDLDVDMARAEFQMTQQSVDAAWSWDYLIAFAKLICSRMEYFNLASTKDIGVEILEYVERSYSDSSLSLQKIADLHGLSVSAISKIFKSTVQVNFSDYLQLLRVHRAKVLFDEGASDVTMVAKQVGYENEITFKRAFQKVELLTPRKYVQRKLAEGDSEVNA